MKKKLFVFVLMVVVLVMLAGCAPGTALPFNLNTPIPNKKGATPAPGQIDVPGISIQIYAPGPNPLVKTPDAHGSPAGILIGIWHGIISPVTLIASFMNPNMQMYEVHNDGNQYNLGFYLGILILIGIASTIIGSRRR
jgi:hypothetical protein